MFVQIVLIVLSVCLLLYCYVKKCFSYWKTQNVPYIQPKFPFGNVKGIGTKYHNSVLFQNLYNELKGKHIFGGIYMLISPAILAIDLDFVKNVLVKDFQYFMNRGVFYNVKDDPLTYNLVTIENEKWKNLRAKMTPTFTSGKIKYMFPTIVKVAEEFNSCIMKEIENSSTQNQDINIKELLSRFTTDVIGTCAFGIECHSLKNPNADFHQMGRKVFKSPRNSIVARLFMGSFPEWARILKMKLFQDDVIEFFTNAVNETIKYREQNNVRRNDFMDILMELKNHPETQMTNLEIAAQCFIFFLAGFETSSTTMCCCLYELALNHDIQDRARKEILNTIAKYDDKLTYEAVMELKYLEQVINETLRKYPPGTTIIRKAKNDYQVPGTDYTIKKGQKVLIPVYAIHHDPEHYPQPEHFGPERFTEPEIRKRHPYAFLPFGEGPRQCIGQRFGLTQIKIGLSMVLQNFRIDKSAQTLVPLKIAPNNQFLTVQTGLWLNFQPL